EGRYAEAARLFRQQMVEDSTAPEPHVEMSFVAYMVQRYDTTVVQLQEALRIRRKAVAGTFQSVYESNAMIEYATGHAYMADGKVADAQAAFGRAISEDLSFYIAHARLGA